MSSNPAAGVSDVEADAFITVTFSEPIDKNSLSSSTFRVTGPTGLIFGVFGVLGNDVIFDPDYNLVSEATYFVKITTGVKDLAGNPIAAEHEWQFTVEDHQGPSLISVYPDHNSGNVDVHTTISVVFSEPIDSNSVTPCDVQTCPVRRARSQEPLRSTRTASRLPRTRR